MNSHRILSGAVCAAMLSIPMSVAAQIASGPALTISDTQVFCQGFQPYVTFTLPIMAADAGRSGMLFVGMRDAAGTAAMFLVGDTWHQWTNGMFPPYEVVASGISARRFTLPLNPYLAGGGWSLYAGYGVLDSQSETKVQTYSRMVQETKAMAQAMKKGGIGSVDPDHYRRTFVQADLVRAGKYGYVNTGAENNPDICNPETR